MTRHVLGLFRGVPGARAFRRHLATEAVKPAAGAGAFREALALVCVRAWRNRARSESSDSDGPRATCIEAFAHDRVE